MLVPVRLYCEDVLFENVHLLAGLQTVIDVRVLHLKSVVPFNLKHQNEISDFESNWFTNQIEGTLWIELAGPQEAHQPRVVLQWHFQVFLVWKT